MGGTEAPGMAPSEIAGITVAGLLVLILVSLCIYFFKTRMGGEPQRLRLRDSAPYQQNNAHLDDEVGKSLENGYRLPDTISNASYKSVADQVVAAAKRSVSGAKKLAVEAKVSVSNSINTSFRSSSSDNANELLPPHAIRRMPSSVSTQTQTGSVDLIVTATNDDVGMSPGSRIKQWMARRSSSGASKTKTAVVTDSEAEKSLSLPDSPGDNSLRSSGFATDFGTLGADEGLDDMAGSSPKSKSSFMEASANLNAIWCQDISEENRKREIFLERGDTMESLDEPANDTLQRGDSPASGDGENPDLCPSALSIAVEEEAPAISSMRARMNSFFFTPRGRSLSLEAVLQRKKESWRALRKDKTGSSRYSLPEINDPPIETLTN